MKKIMFGIFFMILLFPLKVFAIDNTSCESVNTANEKTVEIKITQEINDKESLSQSVLEKAKFKYKIVDLDGNILDETTNDDEGNIIFRCFTVNRNDVGSYKLYKIVMEDLNGIPFDYDSSVIYFSLRNQMTNNLYDPIVAYHKEDGDLIYKDYYKGTVYHATEEELQGKAYAVLDKDSGVLTFFRDEAGKYTNKQEIDNKVYFTGFEEHQSKEWFNSWNNGWLYNSNYSPYIKKIVFKDAVKPNNVTGWFEELKNLEEVDIAKLDTSNLTGLDYFLFNCPKVKKVDISTIDGSGINSMFKSFNNTGIDYLNFTALNLNQSLTRFQISELSQFLPNLKYLNISNFGNWSSSAEFYNMPCLEKLVLNDVYDFYRSSARFDGPNGEIGYWYNIDTNQKYTALQIRDNLYNHRPGMAGTYIRAICTKEASFVVNYNPSKVKYNIYTTDVRETKELRVFVNDVSQVDYNQQVTIKVVPKEGYIIKNIVIKDIDNNIINYQTIENTDEYIFTMPDSDVTITPVYEKQIINPDTSDSLLTYIILFVFSIILLHFVYKKKELRN